MQLSKVGQDSIVSFWRKNFMVDLPEMRRDLVAERLIHKDGNVPRRQELGDKYMALYSDWKMENDEKSVGYEGDQPLGGLDGAYWK